MWETIKEVLNGSNASHILIALVIIVVITVVLVRNNYLVINTKSVKIGADEKERSILRQQTEWTYNYVHGLYGVLMTKYPELNPLKAQLVIECVYDEIVTWIMFNHITRSEMYLMVKQEKIRGVVFAMDVDQIIKEEKFGVMMNQWVKEIINRLVDIREYYSK